MAGSPRIGTRRSSGVEQGHKTCFGDRLMKVPQEGQLLGAVTPRPERKLPCRAGGWHGHQLRPQPSSPAPASLQGCLDEGLKGGGGVGLWAPFRRFLEGSLGESTKMLHSAVLPRRRAGRQVAPRDARPLSGTAPRRGWIHRGV